MANQNKNTKPLNTIISDNDGENTEEYDNEDVASDADDYVTIDDFDYYNNVVDYLDPRDLPEDNPEYIEYEYYSVNEILTFLNKIVDSLRKTLTVPYKLAKTLLVRNNWNESMIIQQYQANPQQVLIHSKMMLPSTNSSNMTSDNMKQSNNSNNNITMNDICSVCLNRQPSGAFFSLYCSHVFCDDCWTAYLNVQIEQGSGLLIGCMERDCPVLATEEFVKDHIHEVHIMHRYEITILRDYVAVHPALRMCPGPNCTLTFHSLETKAKRIICPMCKTNFCFLCGFDYHAPADCSMIKQWLTKCADDSETANYISVHTKDCPKCHICIEKNGGCNHMQCYSCKFNFCWICLNDWRLHGTEYYECSRYREYTNATNTSTTAKAREALKKYLHYYERWENHAKSLKLEEQTVKKLRERINEKITGGVGGTWIDWQYVFTATKLLAKCRYTLQYTYPYAYYMESDSRKDLFEYQQAQLEAEIENLSWKIERSDQIDRGDMENQMDIAEKRRIILLTDFFKL